MGAYFKLVGKSKGTKIGSINLDFLTWKNSRQMRVYRGNGFEIKSYFKQGRLNESKT